MDDDLVSIRMAAICQNLHQKSRYENQMKWKSLKIACGHEVYGGRWGGGSCLTYFLVMTYSFENTLSSNRLSLWEERQIQRNQTKKNCLSMITVFRHLEKTLMSPNSVCLTRLSHSYHEWHRVCVCVCGWTYDKKPMETIKKENGANVTDSPLSPFSPLTPG